MLLGKQTQVLVSSHYSPVVQRECLVNVVPRLILLRMFVVCEMVAMYRASERNDL
jgi:hypothetical protein